MENIKDRMEKTYYILINYLLNVSPNNFIFFFLGIYKVTYFQNKLLNQIEFSDQINLFLWSN